MAVRFTPWMWRPERGRHRIRQTCTGRWRRGSSQAGRDTLPVGGAHAASAWLNGPRRHGNRPRTGYRRRASQVPAQASLATLQSRLLRPFPAQLPQPATTAIDQGLRRDSAFKLFVHHQTFIRHLLRAYPLLCIDEREVVAIDAGNANLVAPDGQGQRLADAVWRFTLADGEIVYLLVERQAEIDSSMPFRMLHAAARMYLILSQNPPRESGYAASTVPRVKHLIIYSGKRPWTAVGEVGQAIRARSLKEERDIPRMECPLLELWRCPDPGGEEYLAVLLGRLQRCDNPETLRAAAEPLKNWPPSESQGALGRAFAAWISEVLILNLGVPDAVKSYRLGAALSDSLAADRAPGRRKAL